MNSKYNTRALQYESATCRTLSKSFEYKSTSLNYQGLDYIHHWMYRINSLYILVNIYIRYVTGGLTFERKKCFINNIYNFLYAPVNYANARE